MEALPLLKPLDSPTSPDKSKTPSELKSQPSDQTSDDCPSWATTTPMKKVPHLPPRNKYHRHSQLAPKYEMLLRFFEALDASLKLLRLRKSMPIFTTKIKPMIEKISERRFTHQHLAQLKYLLPEEMGVKRVLVPDEETHCMKYDLHVSLNVNMMINTKKRKREGKQSCLRDHFVSRLWKFIGTHPEGAEVPEEALPEPFNRKQDTLPNSTKHSHSFSHVGKGCDGIIEPQPPQASHFSVSFKKHFSKGKVGSETGSSLQTPSKSSLKSSPAYVSEPSMNEDVLESGVVPSARVLSNRSAVQTMQKPFADFETCSPQNDHSKATTPVKSAGTPIFMAATPGLKTPRRCRMSPDDKYASSPDKVIKRPSCARSLQFDGPSRDVNIELQVDDTDCSKILDILPSNLLQSLKEKEDKRTEQSKRKQMIARLPKLFDRMHYLFQNPKNSVIRKEALIRDLTECHSDITDQSEVEEQLKLLQEIIPEWIFHKLSPSGNTFYSINKELNPNTMRLRLEKAM